MGRETAKNYLNQITTHWSVVYRAHSRPPGADGGARQALVERYAEAVRRYLLAALGDPDAADEVFQEFTLRLLRGDLWRAHPERGRFRDLLKTALYNLIVDYQRQRRAWPRALGSNALQSAGTALPFDDLEREFRAAWRARLLEWTWAALEEVENATGQPCYSVLRLRVEHPRLSSAELAERLGRRRGKRYTVPAVRQALHRAREKFSDLFLDEVARSLGDASPEALAQELGDLGMLSSCRAALERRSAA